MRKRTAPWLVIALAMAASAIPAGRAVAVTAAETRAKIERIRAELSDVSRRLDEAEHELEDAQQAIRKHERAIANAGERRTRLRTALGRQAVQMYMLGTESSLPLAAAGGDFADTVARIGFLEQMHVEEQAVIEDLTSLRVRAKMETQQLKIARERAQTLRNALSRDQAALSGRLRELNDLHSFLDSIDPRSGTMRASRGRRGFVCPVGGPRFVSPNWGDPRPGGPHQGNDIRANTGQPALAVGPARVVDLPTGSWWGLGIVIRDPTGTEWWYAHLSSRNVRVGEYVAPGEMLGRIGCTGNCYGPHLHFEWHPGGGAARDPYKILSAAC